MVLHKRNPDRYAGVSEDGSRPEDENDRQTRYPLDVRENLSQDCSDLLQSSLNIWPLQRPSVEELCTFPWFNGWQYDSDVDFKNPNLSSYVPARPDYEEMEEGDEE